MTPSPLGDINFSNLLRRVDNHSPYRWALHGYAGIGTIAYRAYQKDINGQRLMTEVKPFKLGSMFMQAGAGLKFKINRRIDLEGRLMYVVTGDDEFDGGGNAYSDINKRSEQVSDNFFNATLGLSVKLGKHESHLMWHDRFRRSITNLMFWPIKTRISKYVKKVMLIMMEYVTIGTDSLTLLQEQEWMVPVLLLIQTLMVLSIFTISV
jgi:hypothetical protein